MRLYYNKYLIGDWMATVLKPEIKVREPDPEIVLAEWGGYPWVNLLMELAPFLKRKEAVEITAYLIEYAADVLRMGVIGMAIWVPEQIRLTAIWLKIGTVVTVLYWPTLIIFTVLAIAPIKEHFTVEEWGHGWTMRYQGRIWDAEYLGVYKGWWPAFRRRKEYGDVLYWEIRNTGAGPEHGDWWYHGRRWYNLERRIFDWSLVIWIRSIMGWVGLMERFEEDVYVLQGPFVKNLPPR